MNSPKIQAPYYPIVYVRGYAGSEDAVEETVATPYMGFNLGATKTRQRWDKSVERYVFESPLVRLMKDHGYLDTYVGGEEAHLASRIPARSVVVYRYYDQTSPALNDDPQRPDIPVFATGLDELIGQVRDSVCGTGEDADELAAGLGPEWSSEVPAPSHGEGPMVGGVRHGEWKLQHPKSGVIERGRFFLGAQHGRWDVYDAVDGTRLRISHDLGGKLHGEMMDRGGSKDGPWRSYEYDMGELVTD